MNGRETLKKIWDATKKVCSTLFEMLIKFWADCERDSEIIAQNNRIRNQENVKAEFCYNMIVPYNKVANAVLSYLQSNYQKVGLALPKQIEAVYCCDENMSIDGDYRRCIFRYECDRYISDLVLGGGKKIQYPHVPSEEIQKILTTELGKYTRSSGYNFSAISVNDIKGNKVRIEISGVSPYGGINAGGYII